MILGQRYKEKLKKQRIRIKYHEVQPFKREICLHSHDLEYKTLYDKGRITDGYLSLPLILERILRTDVRFTLRAVAMASSL